jgi:hypothetical protein
MIFSLVHTQHLAIARLALSISLKKSLPLMSQHMPIMLLFSAELQNIQEARSRFIQQQQENIMVLEVNKLHSQLNTLVASEKSQKLVAHHLAYDSLRLWSWPDVYQSPQIDVGDYV